jgi:hypothetical protein
MATAAAVPSGAGGHRAAHHHLRRSGGANHAKGQRGIARGLRFALRLVPPERPALTGVPAHGALRVRVVPMVASCAHRRRCVLHGPGVQGTSPCPGASQVACGPTALRQQERRQAPTHRHVPSRNKPNALVVVGIAILQYCNTAILQYLTRHKKTTCALSLRTFVSVVDAIAIPVTSESFSTGCNSEVCLCEALLLRPPARIHVYSSTRVPTRLVTSNSA